MTKFAQAFFMACPPSGTSDKSLGFPHDMFPEGTTDNSPGFQAWVGSPRTQPKSRRDGRTSRLSVGTRTNIAMAITKNIGTTHLQIHAKVNKLRMLIKWMAGENPGLL